MRYLLIAFAVLSTCSWSLADELPKVGDTVPEFLMQGSDGKTYKLTNLSINRHSSSRGFREPLQAVAPKNANP